MSYNNGPGPLVLTTENDPSLWRTNSYYKRLQTKRNAARTRKNRPSITNKIRGWFSGKPGATKTRRASRRSRRSVLNQPQIMYE